MEDAKQAVKVYLSKHVGGVMSAFAGEILLYAGVHPSVQIGKLGAEVHARIFVAMRDVLSRAEAAGGRATEVDLFGMPGGYRAMAERKHIGEPCPVCGRALEKISVGGVIAFCPACQAK
jgi:formamidopyrimidine-DNA glycosylase